MSNGNNGSLVVVISLIYIVLCIIGSSSFSSVMGTVLFPSLRSSSNPSGIWSSVFKTRPTPGEWTSPSYGTMGDNPIGGTCPKGSYITDVVAFYGQDEHTNAIQAWCWDPVKKKEQRIFSKPTCGKRDRPDTGKAAEYAGLGLSIAASAVATIFFPPAGAFAAAGAAALTVGATVATVATEAVIAADLNKKVLAPGGGRALWEYRYVNSPGGFYKWAVRPKDDEIQGVNIYGLGGQQLQWAGGNSRRIFGPKGPRRGEPTGQITKATCPKGKIVTGLRASCGDRVDGISFTCDAPPRI